MNMVPAVLMVVAVLGCSNVLGQDGAVLLSWEPRLVRPGFGRIRIALRYGYACAYALSAGHPRDT